MASSKGILGLRLYSRPYLYRNFSNKPLSENSYGDNTSFVVVKNLLPTAILPYEIKVPFIFMKTNQFTVAATAFDSINATIEIHGRHVGATVFTYIGNVDLVNQNSNADTFFSRWDEFKFIITALSAPLDTITLKSY